MKKETLKEKLQIFIEEPQVGAQLGDMVILLKEGVYLIHKEPNIQAHIWYLLGKTNRTVRVWDLHKYSVHEVIKTYEELVGNIHYMGSYIGSYYCK